MNAPLQPMNVLDRPCLFSIEQECQTTIGGVGDDPRIPLALREFLGIVGKLAPSLPGPAGLFNGYGRVYVDIGNHLEFAAIECDSPTVLTQVVEAQYALAKKAARELAESGTHLMLVNNNHDELLRQGIAVWGTHENYLIDVPANDIAPLAIPFLATRTYAGAGGVVFPTGELVAATRPLAIARETGGSTTHNRALFSTCREEHHMGPNPDRFRLHLIVGDGHRSHFNLALQLGATALALKAIQHTPNLARALRGIGARKRGEGWVKAMRRLNHLARPGEPPRVHPKAVEVQRVYLAAAREVVEEMSSPDPWMADTLEAWQATLDAYDRTDLAWLSARLDAFAKYEIYSSYLEQRGTTWQEVPGHDEALSELTLLDHDYHAISEEGSLFEKLETAGVLEHRVAPPIEPGQEAEPFVPDVGTRARARARFIREHASKRDAHVTWECAVLPSSDEPQWLLDPFAEAYTASRTDLSESPPSLLRRRRDAQSRIPHRP